MGGRNPEFYQHVIAQDAMWGFGVRVQERRATNWPHAEKAPEPARRL